MSERGPFCHPQGFSLFALYCVSKCGVGCDLIPSGFADTPSICVALRLQKQPPWKHPVGAAEHAVSGKWRL